MTTKTRNCDQCGKVYEVCSYCDSHKGVYRWRNYFCSVKCCEEYIAEVEKFRASEAKAQTVKEKPTVESNDKTEIKEDKPVKEVLTAVTPKKAAKKAVKANENIKRNWEL